MDTNKCYIYTFCLARWKEKWAQKMQNHSLTKRSNKTVPSWASAFKGIFNLCFHWGQTNFQ